MKTLELLAIFNQAMKLASTVAVIIERVTKEGRDPTLEEVEQLKLEQITAEDNWQEQLEKLRKQD